VVLNIACDTCEQLPFKCLIDLLRG